MFRLAHISDLHLGPLPKVTARELLSKRFTGYVNFKRNRSNPLDIDIVSRLFAYTKTLAPDHMVITGDLINLGLLAEITNAKDWLSLLGNPSNTTVILGNHDAYIRNSINQVLHHWQPWICGDEHHPVTSDLDFPSLRRRGKVSIISCNSARATAPFLATGFFENDQAERLKTRLAKEKASGQCRVVLIHHAPVPKATKLHKRLLGVENFMATINSEGAELILHGHTHLASLSYISGPFDEAQKSPVPVIGVPAAYQWPNAKHPSAGVNLLSISGNADGWKILLERHGLTSDGKFEKISEHNLSPDKIAI